MDVAKYKSLVINNLEKNHEVHIQQKIIAYYISPTIEFKKVISDLLMLTQNTTYLPHVNKPYINIDKRFSAKY